MKHRVIRTCAAFAFLAVAIACGKSTDTASEPCEPNKDPVFGGNTDNTGGAPSGAGGTPGRVPCETLVPSRAFPLIDNFDDGDTRVAAGDTSREGFWFYFGDGEGTFSHDTTHFLPIPGGTGNSVFAAHFGGDGFSDWGFGIGTSLIRRTVSHTCPVDASLFAGIRFRARGQAGPENQGHARITLPVLQTTETQYGGTCKDGCGDEHQHFVRLCPDWREYVLSWSDFQQGGWGKAVAFKPQDLIALHITVQPNGEPGGFDNQPADVWVDDISFVGVDEVQPIEFECDAPPYLGLGGAGTGGAGSGGAGTGGQSNQGGQAP